MSHFGVSFGPGRVPLQTWVRVRELDPGTRVSDPGLDALVTSGFSSNYFKFLFSRRSLTIKFICNFQKFLKKEGLVGNQRNFQ